MARRGRPRKPRLTRMDAAIDAMIQFGFSEDLVRGRVKALLKEYGGDDGWAFIEGDAYKLLIDTILDEQEKHDEEGNLLKDESLRDERTGDNAMLDDAGPSGKILAHASSSLTVEADLDGNCRKEMVYFITGGDSKFGSKEHLDSMPLLSPPPVTSSSPAVNSLPARRRSKPCHGWISSDDEDDDYFIELTPSIYTTNTIYNT